MSKLEVDAIEPQSGTTLTLGASGDTINVAAGATNNLGITEADQWRLTSNLTADANPISSNLERVDNTGFDYIGTGMTVASGIWTFPTTGLYLIRANCLVDIVADDNVLVTIATTTDNSSYSDASVSAGSGDGSATGSTMIMAEYFFNVTNTSTHKIKFVLSSLSSGSFMLGNTAFTYSGFTFIRLGDSQ